MVALCFACGILIAKSFAVSLILISSGGACLLAAAVLCLSLKRESLCALTLCLSFACAGAASWAVFEESQNSGLRLRAMIEGGLIKSDDAVELTGVIYQVPEAMPDGASFVINLEAVRFKDTEQVARGQVRLFAQVTNKRTYALYQNLKLEYGARIRIACHVHRDAGFRNPGVIDFRELLDRQAVDATATIKSFLLVERLDNKPVFIPLGWIYKQRVNLIARITRVFDFDTAAILNASLLGNDRYLSRAVADRFRTGGTFHVLVISGMHIGILGALMLWLMRRVTRKTWAQWLGATLLLWSYALAVGAETSVVRAALMFSLLTLAPVLNRSWRAWDALNALGAAALILLAWSPQQLFSPSFQLTFIAVFALLAVAMPLIAKLKQTGEWFPTANEPHPPRAPRWWLMLSEALFWRAKVWQVEQRRAVWRCRLVKTVWANRFERFGVQRLLRYVAIACIASLCVQVVMLPLLIIYFHRFTPATILLNVWVEACILAMTATAFIALIMDLISHTLALPFVHLTESFSCAATYSVDPLTKLGLTDYRIAEYSGWSASVYVLYFALLLILIASLNAWNPLHVPTADIKDHHRANVKDDYASNKRRLALQVCALATLICLSLILAHPLSAQYEAGRLRIDFLDVGQGDATLITAPDGTTILVDGGGRREIDSSPKAVRDEVGTLEAFDPDAPRIGEAVVSEYLWARGISQVDYLIATHADTDHMQGLTDVARNFNVRAAFVGRMSNGDKDFDSLKRVLDLRSVPLSVLSTGDELRFEKIKINVLSPLNSAVLAKKTNNDSVVLQVEFGNRKVLLTGDVEAEIEASLANNKTVDLRADVVKVAHHGSKTSSIASFVQRVGARIAVIPVGLRSPYNHPDKFVSGRWRASGAQVLTTGECGTITVTTNGNDLRVETFVQNFVQN